VDCKLEIQNYLKERFSHSDKCRVVVLQYQIQNCEEGESTVSDGKKLSYTIYDVKILWKEGEYTVSDVKILRKEIELYRYILASTYSMPCSRDLFPRSQISY